MIKKLNKKRMFGFTLIELMIAISVITLLASIILASVKSAQAKGRYAQRLRHMQELRNAVTLYKSNNGTVPAGTPDSTNGTNWSALGTTLSLYMKTMPNDPLGNSASHYYRYFDSFDSLAAYGDANIAPACNGKTIVMAFGTEVTKGAQECVSTTTDSIILIIP